MADYENMAIQEVQRLARQGDGDALYEMAWRTELMPPEDRNDPIESCAWQDYWFERAAATGHIDARSRYARSLKDRIMNAEDRQKALGLFEGLVADFDAGRLSKDQEIDGIISKLWLGVMLCEGFYTRRDAIRGAKLIKEAHSLTNGFEGFGYKVLSKLGELFESGFAQPSDDHSLSDLEKAVEYKETAIRRFNPERDDPNNRGYLQIEINMLENTKKMLANAKDGFIEELSDEYKRERRERLMKISDAAAQRLMADKDALARLRQRSAREGW